MPHFCRWPCHPNGRMDFWDRFTKHGAQGPGTAFDGQSLGPLDFHLERFGRRMGEFWVIRPQKKRRKKPCNSMGFSSCPWIFWEKNQRFLKSILVAGGHQDVFLSWMTLKYDIPDWSIKLGTNPRSVQSQTRSKICSTWTRKENITILSISVKIRPDNQMGSLKEFPPSK